MTDYWESKSGSSTSSLTSKSSDWSCDTSSTDLPKSNNIRSPICKCNSSSPSSCTCISVKYPECKCGSSTSSTSSSCKCTSSSSPSSSSTSTSISFARPITTHTSTSSTSSSSVNTVIPNSLSSSTSSSSPCTCGSTSSSTCTCGSTSSDSDCKSKESSESCKSSGPSAFKTTISPMKDLKNLCDGKCQITFLMRRRNKTVTLQWQPFEGQVGANGITFLTVNQSICNLPPYPMMLPLKLFYNSSPREGYVEIDPHSTDHIRFHLDFFTNSPTCLGDTIIIPAQSITWITE